MIARSNDNSVLIVIDMSTPEVYSVINVII
jgi:hypothetical protein